jgi:putative ABC transport system permease protein
MRTIPFQYALRNLGRSRTRMAASVLGAALVVLLALASAGFVRGMHRTLTTHASLHENVILLGAGSEEALERSQIDSGVEGIAAASIPGLKEAAGVVFVSPEINMSLPVRESGDGAREMQAVFRGVREVALLVHPEVEIVEGRFPRAGHEELMVGALASTRLGVADDRLSMGRTIHFDNRDWTIVGRFRAPSTVMDAEIWIPIIDLQIATKREASISSVVVSLDTGTFGDADLMAKSRLDLELSAVRERDYYASLSAFMRPIRIMIVATAVLIAIGGILGGLNTMYASFAARVREVGMLQALGFSRGAIVLSLCQESLFAAACGSLIGAVVALLALDGLAVRFSMGAFALTLDAPAMLAGLLVGLAVGLVGAIPPAIRCLRLPIPEALKSF